MADLADHDRAAAVGGRRVLDEQRARDRVDPEGPHRLARAVRADQVRRPGRSSPGGPPSRPRRSGPRGAPRRRSRSRSTNASARASRSTGRPPAASRSDVIVVGEVRRERGGRPVGVDAHPDDDPRVVRAQAVGLAEDPGQLAERRRRPPRRRGRWATSGGPSPPGSPATASAASAIASEATAASRQTRSGRQPVGRNPSESSSAAPGGATHVRPVAAAAGRLLVGDREADLGRAVGQPGADDVVGRADLGEPLRRGPGTASIARLPVSPPRRRRPVRGARARRRRAGLAARSPARPRRRCR